MITTISGTVVRGQKLSRDIGFPTANIRVKNHVGGSIPYGTYRMNILIKNQKRITGYNVYNGIGTILEGQNNCEVHIFDFHTDLYGQELTVMVLEKIRDNFCFDTREELKNQIQKDIQEIKKKPSYVLTFGSFDEIHNGHKFYLESAKVYGDKLVTIVGNNTNIEKFKGQKPKYSNHQRVQHIRDLGISDIVHIGHTTDPLRWINLYHPKVVCLGYDQVGFCEPLKKYIKEQNLDIIIQRIPPYKTHIYKSSLLKK